MVGTGRCWKTPGGYSARRDHEALHGSMGDWPEIEVRSDKGEVSHWTGKVNSKEQDALYFPGQQIEIDYVVWHWFPA
jgi:transcription elongation factor